MISEEQLASLLRHAMVGARPGRPPEGLRARVLAIPEAASSRSPRRGLARAVIAVTGAGAIGLVAIFAGYALLMGLQITGGQGSQIPTPAPEFDPSIDGPGIVHNVNMWLGYMPSLLAGILSATALIIGYRRGGGSRVIAWLVAVVLLLAAGYVQNQPGPEFGYASGPVSGIRVEESDLPIETKSAYVVDVGPGENFAVLATVTNNGQLPFRLDGVASELDGYIGPRWTSVGMQIDELGPFTEEDMEPFVPVTLAPGQTVFLEVVGRAGECAPRPGDEPTGAYSGMGITVAYSIFGLQWERQLDTPFEVVQPDGHCPDP